ncbi:MAG: sulfur carrier protein ThiS [Opitutaceae bacterium]|jgi:sulfur carrier protein
MNAAEAIAGITVNDRPHALAAGATLLALLGELGLAERRGVAAAVNGEVVPKAAWATRSLARNDRVLVIRATQGG